MPETRCSYKNCTNTRRNAKGIKMFRFSANDSDVWITRSGNHNLIGRSPSTLREKVLCEHHFRPGDILPSGRLMHGTLPIQYSSTDQVQPTSNSQHHSMSPRLNRSHESPKRYLGPLNTEIFSPEVGHLSNADSPGTSSAIFSLEETKKCKWIASPSHQKKAHINSKKSLFPSMFETKLLSLIKSQSKNLASKRAKISRLKRQLLKARQCFPLGMKFKSKEAEILFKMQNHRKNTPWTPKEKKIAATLYLRSPSSYAYLRKLLILPAENTIRLWLSAKKCFQTGFNKSLMEKIKIKAEIMSDMEKTCVLMFDEMAIKQCLEYSPNYDLIEGYEDKGTLGRENKIAKEATVFMVRGLFYQWKLPIGYFVSERGLMGNQTKDIIDECINNLTDAGLDVRATVCDQSSTNVKAYNALGVTVDKPYFYTNRRKKVVALFDPPHLIKSLRNILVTHDFSIHGKTISFKDIKQLYCIDSQSGSTRAAPQLTPSHIWPNPFQKMSVSLATQVFSHTTAAALKTVFETGQLQSNSALDRSEFVSQINSLFDAMNSRTTKSRNPDACALSSTNRHVNNIFSKSLDIFKHLKKLDSKVTRPPCFDGYCLTINAYKELLVSKNCSYILTSRLNQDPLENLFSSVRQRGGWNRNPSVRVLRGTMRILTIKQLLDPPKTTSYDPDDDTLLDLGEKWVERQGTDQFTDPSESSHVSSGTEEEEDSVNLTADDYNIVTLEDCSTAYFAGYIAHVYTKKFKCDDCSDKMCNRQSELTNRKELLILNRSFSNVKVSELSGLQSPSDNLLFLVDSAIKVYKRMFKSMAYKLDLVKRLVKTTTKIVSLDDVTCSKCSGRASFILYHLFKVLVHKHCKWITSEVKKTAEAKLKILRHT